MTIEIETPDGIVEFPDGTPDNVITNALRQHYGAPAPQIIDNYSTDPTQGMSGTQKFLAGAGKGMTDIGRGIGQAVGLVGQQSVDDAKRLDAPLMNTGAGTAGAITGGVAALLPTAMIPGVNTAAGAAMLGAGTGALAPVASDESRLTNTALGAAGGVVGQKVAGTLSRVLSPQTAPAVKGLMDQGITPTPGQIMGGFAQKAESLMESIPFLGHGIKESKSRAIEEFNKAALNRALEPIGQKVDKIGHEGIKEAMGFAGKAYDDALAQLPRVDVDPNFNYAILNIKNMGQQLIPERQKQLDQILKEQVFDKITPADTMSGETFKTMSSVLKSKARSFLQSTDYDQRQMGDALNAVVGELRDLAVRNSPQAAEAIKNADSAYAMLLRLEGAAGSSGAVDGIFTPAQLGQSVRRLDTSVRKRASAQGDALMQGMSTAGREVLGASVPNSGTADRGLMGLLLGGAIDPMLAGTMVAGRGVYAAPAQRMIASMLTQRPQAVRQAGDLVRRAAPLSGLTGIEGLLSE
jgi:hypothetical protein